MSVETIRDVGAQKAKADFLVLKTIENAGGEIGFLELKKDVNIIISALEEEGKEAPLHFSPTSGPIQLESRQFNNALQRCRSSDLIHEHEGSIVLTEQGEKFLSNGKYEKTEEVAEFKESVEQLFRKLDY